MKYFGHRKLVLFELSTFNAFNLLEYLTNTDASSLVYTFCPKRTGFNMYAEYTQLQLAFLLLQPCSPPTFIQYLLANILFFILGNYYAFFEIVFMKDNVWNYLD